MARLCVCLSRLSLTGVWHANQEQSAESADNPATIGHGGEQCVPLCSLGGHGVRVSMGGAR